MLIVMMDGHAMLEPQPPGATSNTEAFGRDLLLDVLPMVEREYRVKSSPENRALVGLSMGGGQALTIGLNHPDIFAWVGGFSAAVPTNNAIASALDQPAMINRKLKLLWIGCGKSDFLLTRNQEFIAKLKERGIRFDWHLTEGDHSWPIWRGYLTELAPRLF
jgi:enterochelin esterase-like enzyme